MRVMQAEAGAPLTPEPGRDAASGASVDAQTSAAATEAGTTTGTTTGTDGTPSARRRGPLLALMAGVAVLVLVADRLSKAWALDNLAGEPSRELVGQLLKLTLTFNSGAAFSLGTGSTWVFTIVATVVVVAIVVVARRVGSAAWAVALGLLLGGATGNLLDRLTRPPGFGQGEVVDFLQLPNFPIFNVADMCVVSAAILIGLLAVLGIGLDGSRGSDGVRSQARHRRPTEEPGQPHG